MEPTRGPGHDGEVEDDRGEYERWMESETRAQVIYEEGVRQSLLHRALILADEEEEQRSRRVPAVVSLRVPTAGRDCPVCLDQLSQGDGRRLRITPCSHAFHQPCIFSWLKVNGTCPCCRFKLRADEEEPLLDE